MAEDERIEGIGMTMADVVARFHDRDLEELICEYCQGKEVMKAYVTLCFILGSCIARTSGTEEEAQNTMDMCGAMVGNFVMARHNADVKQKGSDEDEPTHTPATRLQ